MILDEQNIFSDNQKILEDGASENVLYFGDRELAFGTPVELFIQITEDFDNLTSLKISVQTSKEEEFSLPVDLIDETITADNLKAGIVSNIKFLPKGNLGFMRLYYTLSKSGDLAPTKGSILAGIVDSNQQSFHNI